MRMKVGTIPVVGAAVTTPAYALAQSKLTAGGVFQNATPFVQLIVVALVAAMVAAVVICVMKLVSAPRLSGGSAFLSGLRLGGPIAGALGAGYGVLNMCIGLSNVTPTPPVSVLAHGWAESMMLVVLGFLTGMIAVIANWAVESRIDRAVLRV